MNKNNNWMSGVEYLKPSYIIAVPISLISLFGLIGIFLYLPIDFFFNNFITIIIEVSLIILLLVGLIFLILPYQYYKEFICKSIENIENIDQINQNIEKVLSKNNIKFKLFKNTRIKYHQDSKINAYKFELLKENVALIIMKTQMISKSNKNIIWILIGPELKSNKYEMNKIKNIVNNILKNFD